MRCRSPNLEPPSTRHFAAKPQEATSRPPRRHRHQQQPPGRRLRLHHKQTQKETLQSYSSDNTASTKHTARTNTEDHKRSTQKTTPRPCSACHHCRCHTSRNATASLHPRVPPAGVSSKDDASNEGNDAEHRHHLLQKTMNLGFPRSSPRGWLERNNATTTPQRR